MTFTSRSRRALLAMLALSPYCMLAAKTAGAAEAESLADQVRQVGEWKEAAESWVRRLKAKKGLAKATMDGARDKYERARQAFKTWSLALQMDILADSSQASANQSKSLQQAAESAAEFTGYAEGALGRGAGGVLAAMIPAIAKDGTELWLIYRGQNAENRKVFRAELAGILRQLEWREFSEV